MTKQGVNGTLERERPPGDRLGLTHKVTLYEPDGKAVDFYITLNRYPDGRPCEVFVKAGGGYQGWCDAIGRLVSVALQHGVPVKTVCGQLEWSHFSPCGEVEGFGFARSFTDYLARWVGKEVSGVGCQVGGNTDGTDETESVT